MLDQLDHLDRLDDALPPEPDATTLARVRRRATRMRHRNQLAGVGALVVVLAVAGGVIAVARHQSQTAVSVPGSTTTAPSPAPSPTSAGTLPNGLHIEMTVDATTVQLGNEISATVSVSNPTHVEKTIGVGSVQCALGVGPILKDSHGVSPEDGIQGSACYLPASRFPPGKTATFTTSLSTGRVVLPAGADRGPYSFTLEKIPTLAGELIASEAWSLPPVTVEVVAPALAARIEISTPTVIDGGLISGSLVFDNTGSAAVSAGCETHRNYQVSLAAGTVVLSNPTVRQLDPDAVCQRNQLLLPPGTTRFRFKVPAKFYGCSPDSSSDPSIPRCVGHLQTPPLPAGEYEIQYKGAGAVGAVRVAPVAVQIMSK